MNAANPKCHLWEEKRHDLHLTLGKLFNSSKPTLFNFSKLLWLSQIFWISTWMLESACYFYKKSAWVLIAITLNLYINLRRSDIWTTQSPLNHEHSVSFHLFRSFYFLSVRLALYFSVFMCLAYLLSNLFLSIEYYLAVALFLPFNSNSLLQLYQNTIEFCILTLYSATLPKSYLF